MDVHGGRDEENRQVIVWGRHNGLNQQWDIIYVDKWKPEPTKGQLNEFFGFYVERPFHIVSQMPGRRYLDVIDNRNIVIKQPNSYDSQVWWFDQQSRTVKNKKYGQSFNVEGNGSRRNLQLANTNSQWW